MRVCDTVRKWRVLQVVSSSATSGAERHLVLLSRTLQQRGHHVVTVCPPDNWLPQELQRAGVRTLPLPMHGFGSLMTLRRLAQVVREQQIDIIHTHLTRAAYYGLLLGLLMRKPVVSTVHVFTSDPAYRWLSRRGNPLIAVSEAVRNWLVGHGARASEVHTVYNATDFVSLNGAKVNAPADVRSEFRMPCSGKLVGVFAKVTAIKGQDLLLEALPQVLRLHPDVYVLFVGNAEGDFARRIQQHAKDLGVHQRVVFTGLRADVARLMQAVDIVVLPSRM
ncbi:MAG: glycosyltransferase family 4 protein, partial [bacterium]|nr:glycosyltransferase family 4 protein [bacterium]